MLRILLVEDKDADREILREAFAHRGAAVTSAATDSAAYHALQDDEDGFDLLVTDINLGAGTTGFDVARAARQYMPDLPVLYITAYEVSSARHAVPNSRTVRKPVRLSEVADEAMDFLAGQASLLRPKSETPRGA